jgi:hypothetical protein
VRTVSDEEIRYLADQFVTTLRTSTSCTSDNQHSITGVFHNAENSNVSISSCLLHRRRFHILQLYIVSFNSCLPFLELRRSGEFVDRWSPPPVLVPGLALVLEGRVRHVAGPLLNSDRCGPPAPPWTPIDRRPHSLATSEAFAVQTLCVGFNLVDPPLSALAALPESLFHDRP